MAPSWPPWLHWCGAGIVMSLALVYFVTVQHKLPQLLGLAAGLVERRHEARVELALFLLMVVSVPLAIVPSGSLMLAAATLGYVYGLRGIGIAWPGLSLGLALCFNIGRAWRRSSFCGDGKGAKALATPEIGSKDPVDMFLQGPTSVAILRGTRRLLREQPKRTAVLLTFATHAPAAQFLLGRATDILWTDSMLACVIDGSKAIAPLLKGMAVRDVVSLVHGSSDATSHAHEVASLGLKLVIFCALVAVFALATHSVLREIHEEGEAESLLKSPKGLSPGAPGGEEGLFPGAPAFEEGGAGEQGLS